MYPPYNIVEVTAENLDEVGLYCSRSKYKGEGYQKKLEWIRERFKEELGIPAGKKVISAKDIGVDRIRGGVNFVKRQAKFF